MWSRLAFVRRGPLDLFPLERLVFRAVRTGNPEVKPNRTPLPTLPDVAVSVRWRPTDQLLRPSFVPKRRQSLVGLAQRVAARAAEWRIFVRFLRDQPSNRAAFRAGFASRPYEERPHPVIEVDSVLRIVRRAPGYMLPNGRRVLNERIDALRLEIFRRFLIGHQEHRRAGVEINPRTEQISAEIRPPDLRALQAINLFDQGIIRSVHDLAPVRRSVQSVRAWLAALFVRENAAVFAPLRRGPPLTRQQGLKCPPRYLSRVARRRKRTCI